MPDPVDAFITFYDSFAADGVGPDGLPLFRTVTMIRKAKPPLLQYDEQATDEHFEQFPEPYALYLRQRKARDVEQDGYPLSLWPVLDPAELRMLAAREIYTVEKLAALANRKDDAVIPQIKELAQRAKKLIALQKETGRFEIIINDLTQQRDALAEQLKEAHATISAQNAMLAQVRALQNPVAAA
jgi:hypothetical protein